MAFPSVNYKPGSYALIEGKRDSDKFYIIMRGKLRAHKSSPVVGEEDTQNLGPGDFFGVESAMARQGRIETVIAMTECSLLEISAGSFGSLIQKSAPIAMKIIRSFSMKLRDFDNTITRISFRNAVEENPTHLFRLGEFWLQGNRMDHATYAYQRYIQCVPNGEHINAAKLRLQGMQKSFNASPLVNSNLIRTHASDKLVFCENEPGYELYVIREGRIKITKMVDGQEVMLAFLQPGDIFGEMALLDNKPRTATAVTASNVGLLAVNKVNFENMVKAQPQLATKLITLLSERLWTAYRQLANLMIGNTLGRLFDTLLTVAEKNHIPIGTKSKYVFEFGGGDLLKMVGLDVKKDEHYLLNLFKNRWLKLEQGRIICMDLSELQKQVVFYRKKSAMERKRQRSTAGNTIS